MDDDRRLARLHARRDAPVVVRAQERERPVVAATIGGTRTSGECPHTVSAIDGSWYLDGILAGEVAIFAFDDENGFASFGPFTLAAGMEARLDLDLLESIALEGRVTDEKGLPIAFAEVRIEQWLDELEESWLAHEVIERITVTGPDGRFRIPSLIVEPTARVIANAAGFDETIFEYVQVPGAIEIALARSGSLRGRVLLPDGAVLADSETAVVKAIRMDAPDRFWLTGVHDSGFAFDDHLSGEYWLQLLDPVLGFSPFVATSTNGHPVDLRLQKASLAIGRLVSAGMPVAGARVGPGWPEPDGTVALSPITAARSGRDGRFSVVLYEGETQAVVAWQAGFQTRAVFPVVATPGRNVDLGDVETVPGESTDVVRLE